MEDDLELDDMEIIMKVIVVGNGKVSSAASAFVGRQDQHDYSIR